MVKTLQKYPKNHCIKANKCRYREFQELEVYRENLEKFEQDELFIYQKMKTRIIDTENYCKHIKLKYNQQLSQWNVFLKHRKDQRGKMESRMNIGNVRTTRSHVGMYGNTFEVTALGTTRRKYKEKNDLYSPADKQGKKRKRGLATKIYQYPNKQMKYYESFSYNNNNRYTLNSDVMMCKGYPPSRPCESYCNCPLSIEKVIKNTNLWTDSEKFIFLVTFLKMPKDFHYIAKCLKTKNHRDTICYYYKSKRVVNYKELFQLMSYNRKKHMPMNFDNLVKIGCIRLGLNIPIGYFVEPINYNAIYEVLSSTSYNSQHHLKNQSMYLLNNYKSIAPIQNIQTHHLMDTKFDSNWKSIQKKLFFESFVATPKNWTAISNHIVTKTPQECKDFYYKNRHLYALDNFAMEIDRKNISITTSLTYHYSTSILLSFDHFLGPHSFCSTQNAYPHLGNSFSIRENQAENDLVSKKKKKPKTPKQTHPKYPKHPLVGQFYNANIRYSYKVSETEVHQSQFYQSQVSLLIHHYIQSLSLRINNKGNSNTAFNTLIEMNLANKDIDKNSDEIISKFIFSIDFEPTSPYLIPSSTLPYRAYKLLSQTETTKSSIIGPVSLQITSVHKSRCSRIFTPQSSPIPMKPNTTVALNCGEIFYLSLPTQPDKGKTENIGISLAEKLESQIKSITTIKAEISTERSLPMLSVIQRSVSPEKYVFSSLSTETVRMSAAVATFCCNTQTTDLSVSSKTFKNEESIFLGNISTEGSSCMTIATDKIDNIYISTSVENNFFPTYYPYNPFLNCYPSSCNPYMENSLYNYPSYYMSNFPLSESGTSTFTTKKDGDKANSVPKRKLNDEMFILTKRLKRESDNI